MKTGAATVRGKPRARMATKARLRPVKIRRGKVETTSADAPVRGRPRKSDTKVEPSVRERILEVAERLFAEHGMTGVGLRAITTEAKVNLASIAYHFGSKDGLLEALFAQRAAPIAEERLRLLALACEKSDPPKLESILEAFLRPSLVLGADPRFGGPAFVKLRARLGNEPEALSRKILSKAFDQSSRKFIDALALSLPKVPRADIEWRFHFLLGAMFYTMADSGRIQALTKGRCDPSDVAAALRHMIPFLAAGFRSAPVA